MYNVCDSLTSKHEITLGRLHAIKISELKFYKSIIDI